MFSQLRNLRSSNDFSTPAIFSFFWDQKKATICLIHQRIAFRVTNSRLSDQQLYDAGQLHVVQQERQISDGPSRTSTGENIMNGMSAVQRTAAEPMRLKRANTCHRAFRRFRDQSTCHWVRSEQFIGQSRGYVRDTQCGDECK